MLAIVSPMGPVQDQREGDGVVVVRGTAGFGITPAGAPFYQGANVPAGERAHLELNEAGRPVLVKGAA